MPYLSLAKDGSVQLALHIQPKASRTTIVGIHDNRLKIAVASPPVDGKANEAVIAFLASLLGLPKRKILLKAGQQSKQKLVAIEGKTMEEIHGIIRSVCEQGISQ